MAPRPPRLGNQTRADLLVDQTGDSAHPSGMVAAVFAVGLGQGLVTPHPVQGVFNDDTPPREGCVVGHILGGTVFASRFLAWTESQLMQVVNTLIATIPNGPDTHRQMLKHRRLFKQRQVRFRTRHTVRDIRNLAGCFIHGDLAFEGVHLFLATIQRVALRRVCRALHILLETVDYHHQFRYRFQQFIQLTTSFAPRVGQAHRVFACLLQDRQDMPDVARDRRWTHRKKVGQDLMHGILAQPNDRQQNLVAFAQGCVPSAAQTALPVWVFQPTLLRLPIGWQHAPATSIILADLQARHAFKYARILTQVDIFHHHSTILSRSHPYFDCYLVLNIMRWDGDTIAERWELLGPREEEA